MSEPTTAKMPPGDSSTPQQVRKRLERLNAILRAIRNVNQLITRENSLERLIRGACENLTENLSYHNAWVALLDGDGRTASMTASAGLGGQFDALRERLARGEFSACARSAMERDAAIVVEDPRTECTDCPLSGAYGGRSGFVSPLAFEGKTYGVLAVSVPAAYAHDEEERSLFNELAGDLGFALHKIELADRLRETEARVRAKLKAVLSPEGEFGEVELADVIDVPAIQKMMDEWHGLTGIGMAIVDRKGIVLVATGWQDICTKFHRVHPESRRNCIESDTVLSSGVEPGSFKAYRCQNNLWDIVTPIMLGDRHAGNLFLGQFIFEGEEPEREVFREQARRYGFDEAEYLAALDRLPRWSRERVTQAMTFYAAIARQISDLSWGNLKLARALAQRDELLRRLGHEEERLRLALKASSDVVWDWDVVNDTQRWNPSGALVFGWTDIVEAPQTAAWWVDRIHTEDRPRVEKAFFAAVYDPAADRWCDEYRFRKADGSYACVVDRGHIQRDTNGRAVRMIGAMRDITERKRAEDDLRRGRDLLSATEELSGVGGWEWDVASQTMIWTEGTYRLHGFDPGALPAGSPEHIERSLACYDTEDRARIADAFRRCIEEGESYDLECGFTTATGRRLRVRTLGRAVRDGGRTVKVMGNLLDVTEQKRTEEELLRSRALLRDVLDAVPTYICAKNNEGRFLLVNKKLADFYGMPSDIMTGMLHRDLCKDEEELRLMLAADRQVLGSGRPKVIPEETMKKPDGSIAVLETYKIPFTADGQPAVLIVAADITERKRAEEKILQQLDELRRWQDVTLGREERVLELKAEVNELLSRLGARPRYGSGEIS